MRVCFIGKMRSGKDTAVDYILSKVPGKNIKFADPIYEIEAEIYRIINRPIPEDKTKRRYLLQWIGTQFGREQVDVNLWAKIMSERIDNLPPDTNILNSDTRFPNEAELLRSKGFKLVKIERSEETRVKAGATNLTHESETALDHYKPEDFDFVLSNDGTLEEFYALLDKCFLEEYL